MLRIVLGILLSVSALLAIEIGGTWKGNALRPDGTPTMNVLLTVKQDGDKLSGTVGPSPEEQIPITKAKLDGSMLTFEVPTDDALYKVALELKGDDLNGKAIRTQDGQEAPPMRIELKRAK